MKRPECTHVKPKNAAPPVPEIQGKAKSGTVQANPIIEGNNAQANKVFHAKPHSSDKPISTAYSAIDTALARDNLENDLPKADLQKL